MRRDHFEGRVAVVTGSSRGIGRRTAEELARRGARVVLNGRNLDRLEKTREMMEEKGLTVFSVAGDVTVPEQSRELVESAVDHFGRLDILINNAGVVTRGRFEDTKPSVFRQVVETDLLGSVFPALYALPHLKKTGGSLVFISSIAGLRGFPMASPYSASKMALTGLAESLRVELSGTGVHVGVVFVSFTENDPEKRVLSADGTLVEVKPPLQVSQARTARLIVKSIGSRRFKTVLTPIGKLTKVVQTLAPWFVHFLLVLSQKKLAKLYH
jgi:NAD(P)-dependent dehydrogenase (short-subunit alcohol dehydrogenase family)